LIEHPSQEISLGACCAAHPSTQRGWRSSRWCSCRKHHRTELQRLAPDHRTGRWAKPRSRLVVAQPAGVRPDGVHWACWTRQSGPSASVATGRGRNANRLREGKRSLLDAFQQAAAAAGACPNATRRPHRSGRDLYELHDAAQIGPANLHALIAHSTPQTRQPQKTVGFMGHHRWPNRPSSCPAAGTAPARNGAGAMASVNIRLRLGCKKIGRLCRCSELVRAGPPAEPSRLIGCCDGLPIPQPPARGEINGTVGGARRVASALKNGSVPSSENLRRRNAAVLPSSDRWLAGLACVKLDHLAATASQCVVLAEDGSMVAE